MKKLYFLLFIVAHCWSCTDRSDMEKHQRNRDNVIDVQDRVKEIVINDVLIGPISQPYVIGDYLILDDPESIDKVVHLFDRKNFDYLSSAVQRGRGAGEIVNMGHIGIDEANGKIFISDHGKRTILSYDVDSLLADPFYAPKVKVDMNEGRFPSKYTYLNDTLSIGVIIEPIGTSNFQQFIARWNMTTGEIKPMKYTHPEIERKRVSLAVSPESGIYAECYLYHDLMTICDLEGNLKYNIYGPNWDNKSSKEFTHYGAVVFCGDKILVPYSKESNAEDKLIRPTRFLVFDTDGNYIQTLETGYPIQRYCYDAVNNRIIMALDSEIQFAYLDLSGII